MRFEEYTIESITPELTDVFLVRLKPKGKKHITTFEPGQFYHIKNPTYIKPSETHQFSIITTPKTKTYLEFCIRATGPWTNALLRKKPGENVWLFGPMGVFTFSNKAFRPVFIAGGIGITPILSMIQSLHEADSAIPVSLIYANKSPLSILKMRHIETLFYNKPDWKFVPIVSQAGNHTWEGKVGHITYAFLRESVEIHENQLFFLCGSPRFTQNMKMLLLDLGVKETQIKEEVFLPPHH